MLIPIITMIAFILRNVYVRVFVCVCACPCNLYIHHSDVGNAGDDMQHKAISWSNARLLPSIKIPYLRGKRDPGSLLSASVMSNPSVHCIHNTAGLIKLRDKTLARLHQWRCDQSFVFFCGIFWAILGHCNIHQHTTTVDRHTLRLNGDVCGHSQPVPRRREGQRINCGDHGKILIKTCESLWICGQHPYFELLVRLI